MGSLVVASAGNARFNVDFNRVYPASYPSVLGVGGTLNNGEENQYAYARSIHVYAPSENIIALDWQGSQVAHYTGTSFSAPLTAGIGALVKTAFPSYNAGQLREQLRMTADNIDAFNTDIAPGYLGRGRVNAFRAVTESAHPGVRVAAVAWPNGGIVNGVPTQIPITFKNWLATAEGLSVELKLHHLKFNDVRPDGSVTITDGNRSIGTLASGASETAMFTVLVDKLAYRFPVMLYTHHRASTAAYDDSPDLINFIANPPTILDHEAGNIGMSVTTDGNLGFLDYPWGPGKGFSMKSIVDGDGTPRQFLFESSLLVARQRMVDGNPAWDALDCVTGSGSGDFAPQNMDFATKPGTTPSMTMPGGDILEHARIEMVDYPLEDYPIGLEIVQESFVYAGEAHEDFIVVTYNLKNTTSEKLEGIHVGLYFDWRMHHWAADPMPDVPGSDLGRRLAFQSDDATNPSAFVGAMLLSTDTDFHYEQLSVSSDFHAAWMPEAIYHYMSSGANPVANPEPGNWAHILAGGPYDIDVGSSIDIAFAVLGGISEDELKQHADAAAALFDPSADPVAVQFVHNMPDAGPVDVYVSSARVVDDIDFQMATPFLSMTAGNYTIDLTSPSAVDNANPLESFDTEFVEGRDYLVVAAGLDAPGVGEPEITWIVRDDVNLDDHGHAGADGAFFVHGAPRLGTVDVEEINPDHEVTRTFASGAIFGESTGKFEFATGTAVSVRVTGSRGQLDVFRFDLGPGPEDLPVHFHLSGAGSQAVPGDPHVLTVLGVLPDGSTLVPDVRTDADELMPLPAAFVLHGNYPNPFKDVTRIEFDLPLTGTVAVEVFDLVGRLVFSSVQPSMQAGSRRSIAIPATTLASGTYFYRITATAGTTKYVDAAQMTVLR